jgi:predicted RNA-binding protein with PIN domain
MVVRHVIVDGYNVIRADPRLQALERVSLDHARDVLVRTLASSPRLVNDRITVVFDGTRGARSHIHGHRLGSVSIVFSAAGQTADDVIAARARGLSAGARVVVVSNDVELRERCRAEGCDVTGSENLLSQLPGRQQRAEPTENDEAPSLSTIKRGNPRRTSKRSRRQREYRF